MPFKKHVKTGFMIGFDHAKTGYKPDSLLIKTTPQFLDCWKRHMLKPVLVIDFSKRVTNRF